MTSTQTGLRPTYRRNGANWEGVVKNGKIIIWTCGHAHRNRDQSTVSNGTSAVDCAALVVRVAEHPDYAPACRQAHNPLGGNTGLTLDFYNRLADAEMAVAELRGQGAIPDAPPVVPCATPGCASTGRHIVTAYKGAPETIACNYHADGYHWVGYAG